MRHLKGKYSIKRFKLIFKNKRSLYISRKICLNIRKASLRDSDAQECFPIFEKSTPLSYKTSPVREARILFVRKNFKQKLKQVRASSYLSAILNLLEPEQPRLAPIRKYSASMAPDTAEWYRRVNLLKKWREKLLLRIKN